jgi:hypothetical protein
MRVHVIVSERQACPDDTFGCMEDFNVVEQKLVDWILRLPTLPILLDECEDLGVVLGLQ